MDSQKCVHTAVAEVNMSLIERLISNHPAKYGSIESYSVAYYQTT